MSKTSNAMTALLKQWGELAKSHPREGDFEAEGGYSGISYFTINTIFEEWKSTFDILDTGGAWTSSPEMAVYDHTLSAAVTALQESISAGLSNGLNWLMQSSFLSQVATINAQVITLSSKRISISRNLAKALGSSAESNAHKVIEGAKAFDEIIDKRSKVEEDIEDIRSLADNAKELHDKIEQYKRELEEFETQAKLHAASAESAFGEASQAKTGASKAQGEINALKAAAIKRENDLEDRIRQANESIEALKEEAESARTSVKDALRLARDQGLAKSFQERSEILNKERRLWVIGFIGAGLVLLATGFTFVLELPDLTYQSLIGTLLKKTALIAPAIWVGWYCAKQITRTGKIQEDYEYKAASALAYQSYREEASINPDSALSTRLLQQAIQTFGENPVRLYEHSGEEALSPLAELLSKSKPEKLADILASALAKALEKK